MRKARIFLLPALLFLVVAVPAEPQRLAVNTGFTPPVSTIFERILAHALERVGMQLDFREVPAERSLILVNEGIDDAECCRIPEVVLGQYPNLVAVPESVFEVRFVAFTTNPDIAVGRWEDLKPYSVGTVTGWKILVNNIKRVSPQAYFELDDPVAMFKMLDKGRLEVAALGYLSGLEILRNLGLQEIVQVVDPPLATRQLYLMLHKRHAALVPRLVQTLAEMKADGTVAAIVEAVSGTPVPRTAGR